MNSDLECWLALARTPKTRARIRRLTLLVSVFRGLTFLAAGSFALALVGFVLAAIVGVFVPAFRVVGDVPRWAGAVTMAVVVALMLTWFIASLLLEAARYADGTEAVGTITEVVSSEDLESQPQYRLTIVADRPEGGTIRRAEGVSERTAPVVG